MDQDTADRAERTLEAQLTMAIRLASLGISANSLVHVSNTLGLLDTLRHEAERLAAEGRPQLLARINAAMADLSAALATMQGTARTVQRIDAADTKAELAARAGETSVRRQTQEAAEHSADSQADQVRKLL